MKTWSTRLKKVIKVFKLTKYRPDLSGAEDFSQTRSSILTGREGEKDESGSTGSRIGGPNPGAAAQILASMTKPGGINSDVSTPTLSLKLNGLVLAKEQETEMKWRIELLNIYHLII